MKVHFIFILYFNIFTFFPHFAFDTSDKERREKEIERERDVCSEWAVLKGGSLVDGLNKPRVISFIDFPVSSYLNLHCR